VAAFEGDQRLDRAGIGRGDQDLGHVAHLVLLLVGDELDAVVALLPPTDPSPPHTQK
jgi:hypothetical protein